MAPTWPHPSTGVRRFWNSSSNRDVLLHQPFESFDGVAFLREAVHDPQVVAIKQTITALGPDPQMLDLLREAVRRNRR